MMMKLVHFFLVIGSCHGFSLNMMSSVGKGKTTVIAGATGYIGKSVVRESVRQGYNTIALVRDASKVDSSDGKLMYGGYFEGAKIVECDVCDEVFRQLGHLKEHMRMHTNEKPFECHVCEKRYRYASGLRYHMRTQH